MDIVSGLIQASNGWVMWFFLSAALVMLYFSLRFLVWGQERPEERRIFKRFLIVFLVSIFITSLAIHGMKTTLQVSRPCVPCTGQGADQPEGCNPYCPGDYSFPSGHAGTIFTLFVSFFLVYRSRSFLPFFILPLIVAYSRVFLGVHTYADILAGSLIGIIVPVVVWRMEKTYKVLNP